MKPISVRGSRPRDHRSRRRRLAIASVGVVVARCLERIGDHAVDIGEQTYFLVTGEYREFSDASHEQDEVPAA